MLHITCPPDIRTNRDVNQLFVVWFFCLLYTHYGPHGPTPEQKMFRGGTEAMLFQLKTVPVPVLVLSLPANEAVVIHLVAPVFSLYVGPMFATPSLSKAFTKKS